MLGATAQVLSNRKQQNGVEVIEIDQLLNSCENLFKICNSLTKFVV